ncbi:MAG TPA: lipid IV(A) 3-deoxy-D-manno-octulosonic acid transferase, partial [Gammaproteobacteria bacterium]|nr:lipid IV(A) 3-deoxy-D-manno-octulosonic acid transferase [Gammaproteobacteria bacterium]
MRLITLMRYVYSAFFYLLTPLLILRLLWKSRRNAGYRQRIAERFGCFSLQLDHSIWVHAVSVGESLIAVALIKKLKLLYPDMPIVVTTMTPTGAARIKAALGDTVIHLYVPYDIPCAINSFLIKVKPKIAVIIETELWPNLFNACEARNIPIVIANGRLSIQSFQNYMMVRFITKSMLDKVTLLLAQGQADADRFALLGMDTKKMNVTGNIKFDLEVPKDIEKNGQSLRSEIAPHRLVWIAASTHEGEETVVLAAHHIIRAGFPNALLILVPRHPERFSAVADLIKDQNFSMVRRSEKTACTDDTAVYLADTMGEMFLLYAAADVAFVGGSLVPVGGHNLLEPAVLAKPVITGFQLFNFTDISELLVEADAL